MGKRGLSKVVATLLVILLTLISVGIIWIALKSMLDKNVDEVNIQKNTIDISIKEASIVKNNISMKIRRNPGKGEMNGIQFIFEDDNNKEIISETLIMRELEEKTFKYELNESRILGVRKISAYPIIKSDIGEDLFGNPSLHNFRCADYDNDKACNRGDNCIKISNKYQKDSDKDHVGDICDNCYNNTYYKSSNPMQEDMNSDGYGNICDADYNQDNTADELDAIIFGKCYTLTCSYRNWKINNCVQIDYDQDCIVGQIDLEMFDSYYPLENMSVNHCFGDCTGRLYGENDGCGVACP